LIKTARIVLLRGHEIDHVQTLRLKAKLRHLRKVRRPFYLTGAELGEILRWKFGQKARSGRYRREASMEDVIRNVTSVALTITHSDKDYELELRVSILCALREVSIMVASAILALAFPDEYAVIDFRVWRQLFGKRKYAFSISDYRKYMRVMRVLAEQLGWPVQEVDHAIWEYDRRKSRAPWP